MPVEIREVILDQDELLQAIHSYTRTLPTKYPPGRVVASASRSTPEGLLIEASINPPNCGDQVITTQLTGDAPVEMLVRFCLENNIPVPRSGKKMVRAAESGMVLTITLSGAQLE
jgi:hypothetical protein